jgi:hypothetical protein
MRSLQRNLVLLGLFLIGTALPLLSHTRVVAATPGTRVVCDQCEEPDRFVRLQDASEVRGSADSRQFTHPFVLSPEEWSALLTELHVQRRAEGFLFRDPPGPVLPAFTPEEVGYLSTALSQAFAQVQASEMVAFGMSRPNSYGMGELTTGGWFVEGLSLHLVLANYRKVVTMPSTRQLLWERPLRQDAGPDYDLVAGSHQTIVRDSSVVSSLFSSSPSELMISYQAALLGEPVEASAPKESSTPPPEITSTPMSIEDRLRALQRLHDQGLITDEEYRAKKQQLLDRF